MPIAVYVDRSRHRVQAAVSGELSLDEILHAIDRAVEDPAFQGGFDVLSDHRRISRPITRLQLRQMTDHLRIRAGSLAGTRWAVVTTSPASYGMMRILSVVAESVPMEVRVFRSPAEAEHWLARPGEARSGPAAAR